MSNKQHNLIFKRTRKRANKSKVSKREEIIKIKADISEIETKNNRKGQWN